MKLRLITAIAAISLCFSSLPVTGSAADWPQWRGPQRDGNSKDTGLLKQWPADGPKLLWQVNDIGDGYSTPIVVGNRIYLMSNNGMENEFVAAHSTKDGKVIWTTRVGNVGNPNQNPPYPKARSTPTLDGNFLYALSSDGDIACLETKTGKIRWSKNIRKEYLISGEVVLVDASADSFRQKGKFTPPNPPKKKQVGQFPEAAFSYPVIANGTLYIRDLGTLWAYDVKG